MNNADMHAADVATFRAEIASLQKQFDVHDRKDAEVHVKFFEKLDSISRLIYIGLGGVIILGGIVSIIGGNILKILAR